MLVIFTFIPPYSAVWWGVLREMEKVGIMIDIYDGGDGEEEEEYFDGDDDEEWCRREREMTQMTQSTGVGQGQGTELTDPLSQFHHKNGETLLLLVIFFSETMH